MKSPFSRFNTYLLALLAGLLATTWGCASTKRSERLAVKPPFIQAHLEVHPDGTKKNGPVPIGRRGQFRVNVEESPFLSGGHLRQGWIIDDGLGGFFMRLQFNRQGTWLLEQYSTANKGKRSAILAVYDKKRLWLAAPLMTNRIADGVLTFTPDLERPEAERLIKQLNQKAKRLQSPEV